MRECVRIFSVIFCIVCVSCKSYGADAELAIKAYGTVSNALASRGTSGRWQEETLPLVQQMLKDESAGTRREACFAVIEYLQKGRGTASKRKKLASELTQLLADESPLVSHPVAEWLTTLKAEDFEANARSSIQDAFYAKPTKQLILLSGIAGVDSVEKELEEFIFDPSVKPSTGRFYGTLEWAAELVRARNGEQGSIKKVIKAVVEEQNIVTKVTLLLKELEYVRQPEVVEVLKKYLDSDKRLESVRPTGQGLKYAQYAAVILARMLKGFPAVKEDLNYTKEELDICRRWMADQQAWIFK